MVVALMMVVTVVALGMAVMVLAVQMVAMVLAVVMVVQCINTERGGVMAPTRKSKGWLW